VRRRWGILATGSIARTFAEHLPTSATGELVAVASRDAARARAFAADFGVRAHDSYDALLADPDVDAVYIATPHPQHAPWAIRAAEAGKDVLCEKPLAVNEAEAAAMVEAARANGVVLQEAFMYRTHPQTVALVHALPEIGDVVSIDAVHCFFGGLRLDPDNRLLSRELGGGAILDVGCYCVSGALLVAGAEPVEVTGTGHLGATGVDEWALATLTFADGVVANLSCDITLDVAPLLRVHGTEGTITVDQPWLPPETWRFTIERRDRSAHIARGSGTRGLYAHQVDAFGTAPTTDESLRVMRVLDRWRRAVGVTYDADAPIRPVHGGPLRVRADIPTTTMAGVDTPVSTVVLGTMVTEFPETYAVGLGVFDAFFERGGTAFDTAHKYGEGLCDDALGRWMETRGVRDRCVVIGKGAHTPDCDPASLTRQLHESLERLRTDRLDVYLLHRDNLDVPVGEFVDVLDEHRAAGRIRAFGGSNWTLERVQQANDYAAANGRAPA
jgi:predicted dehydrogenase